MAISDFPNLRPGTFEKASCRDISYNCIAWAAKDVNNWWWPDLKDSYWPQGAPRVETLDAFERAYRTLGYEPCENAGLEEGFEKVTLYENAEGPQHAARQLADGRWTSKLGPDEDIIHDTLEAVSGDVYGRPVRYLKRRREAS